MRFNKFLFLILIICLIINSSLGVICASEPELPDKINLEDRVWSAVSVNITKLNDFGYWVNKNYKLEKPAGVKTLEINLITGGGALNVENKDLNLKKAFDADGEYIKLKVNEHDAVFERREFLPDALAVNLNKNSVLTIEMQNAADVQELIDIAAYIIKNLK